ncbi:hypothetical protein [Sulfurimonas sp.]|uniref:hypothetical protein n=1 Tax=Sulfurimonas sp. TaxID=2022749 RepID=UPI002B4A67E7|nr:hypothetical protein [Sulfurimonas sp.]
MKESSNLIKIEQLVVFLNEHFSSNFSTGTIVKLRNSKVIPAVDVRTPETKIARWKYSFEDVKKALEASKQKG